MMNSTKLRLLQQKVTKWYWKPSSVNYLSWVDPWQSNHLICYLSHSSMCGWPCSVAIGRRKHWKWRQSGDLHEQSVGYCVWRLLGKCWCYCGVSAAGLLRPRWEVCTTFENNCINCIVCTFEINRCSCLWYSSVWWWCWSHLPWQCCLQWQWE